MVAAIVGSSFVAGVKAEHGHDLTNRVKIVLAGGDYADIQRDLSSSEVLRHSGNVAVACPAITSKTLVLFAVGQSNAANYVTAQHAASPKVTAFFEGKCYKAMDPLPGASGDRGSIWSRVADELVSSGRYDNAVLSVAAISDTSVRQWAPGGTLNPLVAERLEQMQSAGLKPNVVIFQQGEHDNRAGTDPVQYQRDLTELLAQMRPHSGRTYVALTSGCGIENPAFRKAQQRAARSAKASIGVDMDRYKDRVNVCHLDGKTADKVAAEWARLI